MMLKTDKVDKWKNEKNNVTIMSKPHAYLQTLYKTPAKFQKDRNETVGGGAHKVPTHFI